jgi:uncharacterized membrane protein
MLAAIDAYSISVFLHVSAVVVGFGATFALAVAFPLALRIDVRHLPYIHRLSLAINQRLAGPALLIVLATGIFQVIDGDWSFGDFWISATFAIVIALGALNGAYFMPTDRRLAAQAERELGASGAVSDEYQRQAQREGLLGTVAGVLVLAAVFLMVTKPGA